MNDETTIIPKVGRYYMKGDFLVRISKEFDSGQFTVEYVPNGGGSGAWPADVFKPVTDPVLIATCKQDEARRRAKEHEREARSAHSEADRWKGVVEVLKECPPSELSLSMKTN